MSEKGMFITTGNEIEGWSITAYLGIVRGIVVRSPNIAQGFMGGLKTIVGGDNPALTKVCEQARLEAYNRLLAEAQKIGANAIIGMRYDATEFADGLTEVLAYGTAVTVEETADA